MYMYPSKSGSEVPLGDSEIRADCDSGSDTDELRGTMGHSHMDNNDASGGPEVGLHQGCDGQYCAPRSIEHTPCNTHT